MPDHGVDPGRDEDVSPLEHNLLPSFVDQEEARDDDGGADQLTDGPHVADEERRVRIGRARQEIDRQGETVHLGKERDHEAHVRAVGLPGFLDPDRRKGQEKRHEKDIQESNGPAARRNGRARDESEAIVKIRVDAGHDLIELVEPDDDRGNDRREGGNDPNVEGGAWRRRQRRSHGFGGSDSGTDRLALLSRLLEVVLRNWGHRRLQDLRISAFPLREPRDDEEDRAKEDQREPDRLGRDGSTLGRHVQRHDEPLRRAGNHGVCDAQEPREVPQREQIHLVPSREPHAITPRLRSHRAYQYMIPMNANPRMIWPKTLATAQGHGAMSARFLPNGATSTPLRGSTTGPCASVKSPYKIGRPAGIGRVVGAAGMFPTFCTETPTWRWRNVGWIERIINVAVYWVFGTSSNEDAPIHW